MNEKLIDFLKQNKEQVIAIDRSGNIISLYLKDDFKLQKFCSSKEKAKKLYTKYRQELEDIYL